MHPVKDPSIQSQFCITVFFDIKKAYDTAFRHDILSDLKSFGVSGYMLNTLASYTSKKHHHLPVGEP